MSSLAKLKRRLAALEFYNSKRPRLDPSMPRRIPSVIKAEAEAFKKEHQWCFENLSDKEMSDIFSRARAWREREQRRRQDGREGI